MQNDNTIDQTQMHKITTKKPLTKDQTELPVYDNQNNEDANALLYYPGIVFKKCWLPKCCHGLIFLLILMCWAIVGQGMIVSGQLPITLPMLEKNFGYSSVQTGLIHSFYDIFVGIGAILVGFFGRRRKIMVIGIGVFVISLGCFIFTLPNFLYNFKEDANLIIPSNGTNQLHTIKYIDYGMCNVNQNMIGHDTYKSKIEYLIIFCIGYSLIGIGSAPLHTLAVVYFDEHLNPQRNGMFLGIYYLFGAVGPALGFGLGSPFLSLPVTLKNDIYSYMTPSSEGWIGAWWLGYIFGGGMLLFVGTLLVLYPSRIPPQLVTPPQMNQQSTNEPKTLKPKFYNIILYFKSFKKLITNIPYLTLICGMAIEGIAINGLGTFLTKIIEVQFRISPSNASLLSGALVVLGAGIGIFTGGIIIKKIRNCPKRKALLIFITALFSTMFFGSFFFGCSSRDLDKILLNEKFEVTGEKLPCQSSCNCHSNKYEPVCNLETEKTYFSPCMAGCRSNYTDNNRLVFHNCACLPSINDEIVQGGCNKDCNFVWAYIPLSFIALLLNFMVFVPELSLMLQLLNESTKNSGTGLQQISARVGFIIGPILYGYLLDITCSLWSTESTHETSNCSEYNNPKMRIYISSFSIGLKFISAMCYLATYLFTRSIRVASFHDNNQNHNEKIETRPSAQNSHVEI